VSDQSSHVDRLTNAFNAMLDHGDLEAIISLFEDDSTLEEPAALPYGGKYRGRDAIRSAFLMMMDHWNDLELVMPRMIDGGKTVVTMLPFSARSKTSGRQVKLEVVEFWDFDDDDRLASVRVVYGDTKQVLDALAPA
jgi:ketosteroid isomerase-like protein